MLDALHAGKDSICGKVCFVIIPGKTLITYGK